MSQFGDLDSLIRLSIETGCGLTVDFSHLYARAQGAIDYTTIIRKVSAYGHLHCHFSGIEFGPKGERKHLDMDEGEFMLLAKAMLASGKDFTVISESPRTWEDSVKMKSIILKLQNKKV
jgi:deoxyribonuclease-4